MLTSKKVLDPEFDSSRKLWHFRGETLAADAGVNCRLGDASNGWGRGDRRGQPRSVRN